MSRRDRACAPLLLALAACRPSPSPAASPDPAPAPSACTAGVRLADLSFVPVDAELVAIVDLTASDLERALDRLAQRSPPEPTLPIQLGFSLAQMRWQVPLLREQLARGGQRPDELVLTVSGRDGPMSWWLATSCDVETLERGLGAAFGVGFRRSTGATIGTAAAGHAVPFDVVLLPGDLVALAPAGQASAVVRAFSPARTPEAAPRSSPVQAVSELAPAAVRVAWRPTGLLAPGPASPSPGLRTLRASGAGLESAAHVPDATVSSP